MTDTIANKTAPELPALLTKSLILSHFIPVGVRTLDRWIAAKEFPAAEIAKGAKLRFWRRETVENWIEANAN